MTVANVSPVSPLLHILCGLTLASWVGILAMEELPGWMSPLAFRDPNNHGRLGMHHVPQRSICILRRLSIFVMGDVYGDIRGESMTVPCGCRDVATWLPVLVRGVPGF